MRCRTIGSINNDKHMHNGTEVTLAPSITNQNLTFFLNTITIFKNCISHSEDVTLLYSSTTKTKNLCSWFITNVTSATCPVGLFPSCFGKLGKIDVSINWTKKIEWKKNWHKKSDCSNFCFTSFLWPSIDFVIAVNESFSYFTL